MPNHPQDKDRRALVIWGGWEGHQPEQVAELIEAGLRQRSFTVSLADNVNALLSEDLEKVDLIVPVWSRGIPASSALQALLRGVQAGAGLATLHAGIDWFTAREYAHLIGGHFVFDTPLQNYTVHFSDPRHAITQGMQDFAVVSEMYYLHVDPTNTVLTTTRFDQGWMPNTWIRSFGAGRVFYTSLAHSPEVIQLPEVFGLLLRGMEWAARSS